MTTLGEVATFLPAERIPIGELAEPLGLTEMQIKVFRRYHGLNEVRRDRKGDLLDLLLPATSALDGLRGNERHVRYVVHARAFPVVAPYPVNPLRDLCERIGLAHALAVTVSHQSCATGLLAIDLAGRLLAGDPDPAALALILAGEKAFTLESQLLPETSIFGEGAAACLVSRDGPGERVLAYVNNHRGEFDGDQADVAAAFQREYPNAFADVIRAAADRAGMALDEFAMILPHNVNLVSWQRLCRRLGFPVARVLLDNVPTTGHVFCADAFFNLRDARERGLLRPGDRYLVAAAGAGRGATFSAMVLEHRPDGIPSVQKGPS
jgi:3-oxoacyl-[acyl-carrier-protein] synthase-3